MSDETSVGQLAELFKEAGEAHQQAFMSTGGEDPDWPLWYADYLHDRLRPFLAASMTRSRLVVCLVATDDEHRATEPDTPWPSYYARRVRDCLGAAEEPKADKLALYHFNGCPFCTLVRRESDALGLEVELRDIHAERKYLEELLEARGWTTVPVLRITSVDGEERWMPESADIVRYLRATYGKTDA